jgi:RNA polymerase sigma-70 factor, ECF subfamily
MIAEDYQNKSDEALAKLVLDDPHALVVIIRRYESRLLSYIRRISGFGLEDAEDILQDSFMDAYRNMAAFDPNLKFSSWMYRIVHNRTISAYRKRKKELNNLSLDDADEGIGRLLASHLDSEKHAENSLNSAAIGRILKQLPERDRTVLVLAYMEEKTYEEISDILHAPANTVATWIRRAKQKFQKLSENVPMK